MVSPAATPALGPRRISAAFAPDGRPSKSTKPTSAIAMEILCRRQGRHKASTSKPSEITAAYCIASNIYSHPSQKAPLKKAVLSRPLL